jgi:hypothetical protein
MVDLDIQSYFSLGISNFFVLIEIENIENNTINNIKPIKASNVITPIFIPWLIGESGFP